MKALTVNIEAYWCDSTITLARIAGISTRLKTFVGNRVSEIQELTKNGIWKYVPSQDNPANIVSRGVELYQLIQRPDWLAQVEEERPEINVSQRKYLK